MEVAEKIKYTLEEYLSLDESDEQRYEYFDGVIFPVVDTSIAHNEILSNVHGNIFNHLKGKPCKALTSTQKVKVERNSSYCLPDILVVCGEIKTMFGHNDIITNPSLIIEILSPSTQDFDLGGKFKLYRNISSLVEYICISTTEPLVLKHNKTGENVWTLTEFKMLEDTFLLESINMQLNLKAVFEGVTLDTQLTA